MANGNEWDGTPEPTTIDTNTHRCPVELRQHMTDISAMLFAHPDSPLGVSCLTVYEALVEVAEMIRILKHFPVYTPQIAAEESAKVIAVAEQVDLLAATKKKPTIFH